MTSYEIEPPPEGKRRGLLHSCCAPCAGEVMEAMSNAGLGYSIFFYNPNIHPRDEYEVRKQENIRFAGQKGIEFIDADYDSDNWFARVKGLEWEPERGARCTACFDMRFERSALYAVENGFDVFTSCLGISRWKNMEQINGCGQRAATRWPGLHYWTYNWRKKGGASRMQEISKREQFYQQEYCGELDAKDALRIIAAHAESGGERGAIRADHALFASHFKLRPSHAHAFLEGVGMFGGMNPKIESPRRHFLRSNADEALTRLFRL